MNQDKHSEAPPQTDRSRATAPAAEGPASPDTPAQVLAGQSASQTTLAQGGTHSGDPGGDVRGGNDGGKNGGDQRTAGGTGAGGGRSVLGLVAVIVVLLVGVGGVVGGYWLHQRLTALEDNAGRQIQTAVDTALAAQTSHVNAQLSTVAEHLEQVRQSMADQARRFETQVAEARNARQNLLADVEGRLAAVDAQQARIEALQSRMDTLLERIDTLRREQQPTVMLRWQAARDLLGVGRLQVQRLQDVDSALQHYRAARELLLEQGDARSAQVISLVDEELQRIEALPTVDTAALGARIQELTPLLHQWAPAAAQEQAAPAADAGWWDKLRFQARRAVTVRRAEALDKVDVEVVRQALRLHLLAAQAALVARDAAALNRHAGHARALIQEFGTGADAVLAAAPDLLTQLVQLDFALSLPALGQAEERLRQFLRAAQTEVAP